MKEESGFQSDFWQVNYTAADGGRLTLLRYKGCDLLTLAPDSFMAPRTDYGLYETRPVYGYDDCFPTVGACRFPEMDWDVPDHGELCWLAFTARAAAGRLLFQTASRALPVRFERALVFSGNRLSWQFKVTNAGLRSIPFQHIMHPLMPVKDIAGIRFPACASIFDERTGESIPAVTPPELEALLLNQPAGAARMLFLRDVAEGRMTVTFRSGLLLSMRFPPRLFPTIGVWWNNGGYPAEEGCRRFECAFEPTPGGVSRLDEAYAEGRCLYAEPGNTVEWTIVWNMEGE